MVQCGLWGERSWLERNIWVMSAYGQNLKQECREFPGGPVVRTRHFHCRGPEFNPSLGN